MNDNMMYTPVGTETAFRAYIPGDTDDIDDLFDVIDLDGTELPSETPEASAAAVHTILSAADDALIACLNECGRVDMARMCELSGLPVDQLITALRGSAIYQDPESFSDGDPYDPFRGWVPAQRYLSGHIPGRLAAALEAEKRYPGVFDANIGALRALMPPKLTIDDIHVSLGEPWLPPWFYAKFLQHLLGFIEQPRVHYSRTLSAWKIDPPPEAADSVRNRITYGTSYMSALRIAERTMNAASPKVFDCIALSYGRYDRILNRTATLAVQEKQRLILDAFKEWLAGDKVHQKVVEDCYNEAFNGNIRAECDGSFLRLPGLNPEVKLYPYQKNAVAHALLFGGNMLFAHDVGTGKTYVNIVCIHELKRLGLSEKNLIVVPNNVLRASAETHKYLYPDDKLLVVYPSAFRPDKRDDVLHEIRDGDYTAIYMAHSSFDQIVMSRAYRLGQYDSRIRALRAEAGMAKEKSERERLEREASKLTDKRSEYFRTSNDTPWLTYDALGIDTLVVDEAHNYKNIPLTSRTDNVVGMHAKGSVKCAEMIDKVHTTPRVFFTTGTPLTNSLADLYVLQEYLQPGELAFRGIESFDMWVNTFCERETNYEVDVDSSSLREITRFSSFHNLPELMGIFSSVCDFYHPEGETAAEGLPLFRGFTDITVDRGEAQAAYILALCARTEAIRSRKVKRTEDNLLKVTSDGHACAVDIRLVDPYADVPEGEGKIARCADEVKKLYDRYPGTAQIVFSDIGTPNEHNRAVGHFCVYDALRDELIARGIPADEIAFVHDAVTEKAREALFAAMNAGKKRVVIGSTAKLGVGINVQEKLVALHHLTVPWRPADMIQREGRILRQGNTCPEVFILRYSTKASFDSYSWQILENKQRFIASFLSGSGTVRDSADIADTVLSYAEIKALCIGDPLIKKRVETANSLERLRIAFRQRQKQLVQLREVLAGTPALCDAAEQSRRLALSDTAYYQMAREPIPNTEREAFGEELLEALHDNVLFGKERLFGDYQGFDIILPAGMTGDRPHIYVRRADGGSYYLDMDADKPLGCTKKIDYLLDHLTDRAAQDAARIENYKTRMEQAKADLAAGNNYADRIGELESELEELDAELAAKAAEEAVKADAKGGN